MNDTWFRVGTGAFALIVVSLVAAVAVVLWTQSRPSIAAFGFTFWRTSTWDPVMGEFGAAPFIWGTLYSSFLALFIAAPVAIGIAIFLSELCPAWLRAPLIFITELLASIPSIVYGLWGIFVLVPLVRAVQLSLPASIRALPMFAGPPVGVSLLAAALILAVMIVPFTSSVAREVLRAVPLAQREGAYALGATRWEATMVAIQGARVGILGAVMLGLGRALGETMAVTMVIGNTPQTSWSVFAPQYTMSAVIANQFAEAADPMHLSALVEIGLLLFMITLGINVISRLLIWRMARS
jgi:phosphate transport system permease protein